MSLYNYLQPSLPWLLSTVLLLLWPSQVRVSSGFVVTIATTRTRTKCHVVVPGWQSLEHELGSAAVATPPRSIDSVLDSIEPSWSNERPTLFRERHGWCPYSERVWLALEMVHDGNKFYDTVRIDNTGGGRPAYFGYGQTPQVKWPEDGRVQGESYDLVQEIDRRYNHGLWKCRETQVQHLVDQFRSIFPRARPSSRAAFLFQNNGSPLSRQTFEQTLQQTNDLLGRTKGPFFAGDAVTGADLAWVPFLERYRFQLPCLHSGLQPDDEALYPLLAVWYRAMEEQIPAYACRVQGNASSWRKVLTMAGFGNSGVPLEIHQNMEDLVAQEQVPHASGQQDLWNQYAATRPFVAATPRAEAGLVILRNRQAIVQDCLKQQRQRKALATAPDLPSDANGVEQVLRDLVAELVSQDQKYEAQQPELVQQLAAFLDDRMCVPRDMGAMSAAAIKQVALQSC